MRNLKNLLLAGCLCGALGGCAETQTILGDISTTLGQVSTVAGAVSSTLPALCSQLNQISTSISNSALVTAAQSAAISKGTAHYNTYCGPAVTDSAIIAIGSAQIAADIAALQSL